MKVVATLFLLISSVVFGGIYYYWTQATNLPDWYTQEESGNTISKSNEVEIQQAEENLEAKITASTQQAVDSKNVEVQLTENELSSLVVPEIAKKVNNSRFERAVKAVKTDVEDGKVQSGAVINISELKTAQLREREKAVLTKVIETFPALEDKEVYIGIEGKPTLEKGQLNFDNDTKIKLGNLSFTPSELSKKLGVSESRVRELAKIELQLGRLKVEDVELTDDKVLLKGSVNPQHIGTENSLIPIPSAPTTTPSPSSSSPHSSSSSSNRNLPE